MDMLKQETVKTKSNLRRRRKVYKTSLQFKVTKTTMIGGRVLAFYLDHQRSP